MEWAEVEIHEIGDLSGANWEHSASADEKLHDFLLQLCGDEAQVLIDTPYLNGRGFEAWRLLNHRYSPCGGQYELDAMLALMQRKPVQNAIQVPGAISKLERDIALYTQRTGKPFPEDWKVPILLQLLPKAQADTLKLRYAEGLTNYRTIVQNLMTFSQTMRFDGAYGRGDNDMDIGAVEWDSLTSEQTNAYWTAFQRGLEGEEPAPPPPAGDESFIDALIRKGKGKGKSKRGPMTKAYQTGQASRAPNPLTAPPQPGQPDRRICHRCQKMGHVMAACPDKKAGKPKVAAPPRSRGAGALDTEGSQQDWVEERNLGGLFRDCCALDAEWNLNAAELVDWVEDGETATEDATEVRKLTYGETLEDPLRVRDPWMRADQDRTTTSRATGETSEWPGTSSSAPLVTQRPLTDGLLTSAESKPKSLDEIFEEQNRELMRSHRSVQEIMRSSGEAIPPASGEAASHPADDGRRAETRARLEYQMNSPRSPEVSAESLDRTMNIPIPIPSSKIDREQCKQLTAAFVEAIHKLIDDECDDLSDGATADGMVTAVTTHSIPYNTGHIG